MVDTCAAEFAAETPYYYSVYGDDQTENEAIETKDKKKILVLTVSGLLLMMLVSYPSFANAHVQCTEQKSNSRRG